MKRLSLLLFGLFLFCGWVGAQNEKISFNETNHDFGLVGEKDGYATFDFILTNLSNEPIVLTTVAASCGCTTPVWTKEPIEAGQKGTISVSYNPLGRIGPFNKTISVYMSNQSPVILRIRGTVVQRKPSPQDEYPVALGSYLLKTKDLNFGQVSRKDQRTIRLEVYNNSDNPITQKILKLPKNIAVTFNPTVIPAKTSGIMDVALNVEDNSVYGKLSGEFTLLINEVRQSFPYSATVLYDFSQWTADKKVNAGKINIIVSEINFGNFNSGYSKTLKISNSGKAPLNILAIQTEDPAITVSKTHFVINKGEIADVKVNVDSKKVKSTLSSKLSIFTDDPNTPIYEIGVLGYNQKP